MELLTEKGADANADNTWNGYEGGLALAAGAGHEKIVELLIEKGANINAAKGNALAEVVEAEHRETIELLIEKLVDTDTEGTLRWATGKKRQKVLELLIEKKLDVKAAKKEGRLLIWAAKVGNQKIVELLIEGERMLTRETY